MNLLKPLTDIATNLAGKYLDNKGKAAEFVAELQGSIMSLVANNEKARAQLIGAEIASDSWLATNWRPMLMLTIVAIVFNNYILAPYVNLFFSTDVTLDLPDKLWNLMMIGVGGYIPGRSLEKAAKAWKSE